MNKCLYCYKPLKEGQTDFHPACAHKLFGIKEAPILPYRRSQIADLAKQVVRAQTTLTGVQAKLSLDVNPGGLVLSLGEGAGVRLHKTKSAYRFGMHSLYIL